jgi:hypothetical protein
MTKRTLIGAAAVVALLALLPGAAQLQSQAESRRACHPEGTWFGANTYGNTFLVDFVSVGGGRYYAVSDGFNPNVPLALQNTGYHGELVRTGPRSFWFRQLAIYEFNPDVVPLPPGLYLMGGEGPVIMSGSSCDHFDMHIDVVGMYSWNPFDPDFVRPVPFVDEFDIPLEPGSASYDRMPPY